MAGGKWYGSRAVLGTWKAFIYPIDFKHFSTLIDTTIWREDVPCNLFGSQVIVGESDHFIATAGTYENGNFIGFRYYNIQERKTQRLRNKLCELSPSPTSTDYEIQFSYPRIAMKGYINNQESDYRSLRNELLVWDLLTEKIHLECGRDLGFVKLGCFTIYKQGIGLENDGKLYLVKFSAL